MQLDAVVAAIEAFKVGHWHDLVGDIDSRELAEAICADDIPRFCCAHRVGHVEECQPPL